MAHKKDETVSFLQLRGALRGSKEAGAKSASVSRVRELLDQYAHSLKSPILSVAALKVYAAQDHFVKVRALINDLINQLVTQAENEAEAKADCDKETNEQQKILNDATTKMKEETENIETSSVAKT